MIAAKTAETSNHVLLCGGTWGSVNTGLDPASRFNRLRSARNSPADWQRTTLFFFQRLADDLLQLRRQIGVRLADGGRAAIQYRLEDYAGRSTPKGWEACRHLVKYRTKREQISPCVQLLALHLLGRHVSHRADGRPRTGEVFGRV